jgi:hypothetical protein
MRAFGHFSSEPSSEPLEAEKRNGNERPAIDAPARFRSGLPDERSAVTPRRQNSRWRFSPTGRAHWAVLAASRVGLKRANLIAVEENVVPERALRY